MNQCDICGTKIENARCKCGIWESQEETDKNQLKKALELFHEMKQMTFSADIPHLGCAAVFFRGSYKDCEQVKEFIYKLQGRPYCQLLSPKGESL